jgi:hypothetical protein
MPARTTATQPVEAHKTQASNSRIANLITVRLAIGDGATRAELMRDLRPVARSTLAPAAWRTAAEVEIVNLLAAELITETRARLQATNAGRDQVARFLGAALPVKTTWTDVRDGVLTACALGLNAGHKSSLKTIATPDGLRALIVQRAFAISDAKPMSLAKLRACLAVKALERAFGNKIKSGLGSGGGLAAKPSRLLAGQLSKAPRDYGSDSRLIAALAAEHLATSNSEVDTLRLAVVRNFIGAGKALESIKSPPALVAQPLTTSPINAPTPTKPALAANDHGEVNAVTVPAARPDLAGFIRHVQSAAARRAEGWPGNRKAFICHVWQEIKSNHPAWALSEIEFKGMLAEAHRSGGLVLANADLKDKKHIQEFENSAIQYMNTVWHFVRVTEA